MKPRTPQVPAPAGSTPLGLKPAAVLTVGDAVMWRGGFGMDAARRAVVVSMERTRYPRQKYGEDVQCAPWSAQHYLAVTLDNGHWAYGEQLSPIIPDPSPLVPEFRETDCGGAFDGTTVSSDADGGL